MLANRAGGRSNVQRWRGLEKIPPDWGPSVVAIGVFDGVHRGHQYLLDRAVQAARRRGVAAVVVTFDPHPLAVVRPGHEPLALASLDRRLDLLAGLGLDAVCVLPFSTELSRLSAEDFAVGVLADRLHVVEVVVGENFRFGHKAAGDVDLLTSLGRRHGFAVDAVPTVGDTEQWSSTRVRAALDVGDVETAAELLGRPYRVEGEVVVGDRRGRALGYPTANLARTPGVAVPADGVYAGYLVTDLLTDRLTGAERLPAAISVGTNPTFDGSEQRVEAYALDRDDLDLYGAVVGVEFTSRLRDTVRFDSVDDLLAQMAEDVADTRARTQQEPQRRADG